MAIFYSYFKSGLIHILNRNEYDYILFIIALCAIYLVRDWRTLLMLVTALILGHLFALSSIYFHLFSLSQSWINFLTAIIIFATALSNIFKRKYSTPAQSIQGNYVYAFLFAAVQGIDIFLNFDKSTTTLQHIAFNFGIEIGKIIVIALFMMCSYIFLNIWGIDRRDWNLVISSSILGISLTMIFESWIF